MSLDLSARIPADGEVALHWNAEKELRHCWLLAVRTGAKPGFTSLKLDGKSHDYRFTNLGRHQRYRFAVLAAAASGVEQSAWLAATPRNGLVAVREDGTALVELIARMDRVMVMPQDQRLTIYWQLSRGFVDRVKLELRHGGQRVAAFELEPEVQAFTLDVNRVPALRNGETYELHACTSFAGQSTEGLVVQCTPAPQGREREMNTRHPQRHLVYPCLSLTDELDVFEEKPGTGAALSVVCGRCNGATEWRDYRLVCRACRAEYIANARGDWLDVTKLRFGTCRCCLPKKLLILERGSDSLRCAHSRKEYIRLPGENQYTLIEELPFGLCQCCRPRRPLARKADATVRCTRSDELHRRSDGNATEFVLVPSAPVFDATAIDELLDQGLADICSAGVSRGRR